jgi:type I restriction enzyme S subunit
MDAMYYHPRFLANEERLTRSGTAYRQVRELVSAGRRAVYFGTTTHERESAPPTWVPFLTADDLGDDGFYLDQSPRRLVSPEFAARYPNGWLRPNEILVKVKGPNQIAAYNPATSQFRTLVSGTLWGALVRNNVVDAHFLLTALSCPYAAMARERLRTNTNVEFLAAEDLMALELPYLKETQAQVYIGDKVRQAERLRERARLLEVQLCSFGTWNLETQAEQLNRRKAWRVQTPLLTDNRLDPNFYRPGYLLAADATLDQSRYTSLSCVVKRFRYGASVAANYVAKGEGITFIRGNDLQPNRVNDAQCVDLHHSFSVMVQRHRLTTNSVLITRSGTVGVAAPVTSTLVGAAYGSFMIALELQSVWLPEYVAWFLNSPLGVLQIRRLQNGAVQQNINIEELKTIKILKADSQLVTAICKCVMEWVDCLRLSSSLVTGAKSLVEALIDGKVTETDLVQAQESLERHDRCPDRALLARLTTQGMDIQDATPLFPDLDKLYELLDQNDGEDE